MTDPSRASVTAIADVTDTHTDDRSSPAPEQPARPAHRPSRSHEIVDAAMRRFATAPIADVTVKDIADDAGMTSAAVYYHFASKDQILVAGLERFGDDLVAELADAVARVHDLDDLATFVGRLLDWAAERPDAVVHVVSAAGLNLAVEATRRTTRRRMLDELEPLTQRCGDRADVAASGVVAVGVLTQLEVSLASMLSADEVFQTLGPERFRHETAMLIEQLLAA